MKDLLYMGGSILPLADAPAPLRGTAQGLSPTEVLLSWSTSAPPAEGFLLTRLGVDAGGANAYTIKVEGERSSYIFTRLLPQGAYTFFLQDLATGEVLRLEASPGRP